MQTSPLESRSNVPSQPTTPQSVEPAEELRSRVSAAPVFVPRNKPAKYVLPPLRTKFPPQSPSVKANDPERPPLKGKSRAKPAPRTAVWRSALVVRAVGLFVAHAKAPNGWKTISGAHLLKAMIDFDDNMRIVAIPFNGHGATSFDATVDSLETTITDWAIYNEGQMFVVTLRERAGLMRYKFQIQNSDSAQQLVDAIAKRIVRKPGPPTLMTTPKNTPKSSTPKAASKLQLATRPSPPPLARTHSTFMLPPASIPAASSSQPVASTSQAPSDSLASPATSSVPLTPRMGFPPIPPIALMADEAPPSSQKRGLQTPAAKKASPLDVALPPTPERPDEEANTDADDEDSFSNTSDRGSPSPCGSP
ncbi:hypothetical protein BOTBODRAFT_440293 [Botryobasidium botryosum FD-172 SS1]|uniref:Uncharacterized protein n=1 Tax=Botryobasidium botryosum (strain FD-172 SS1) TaxID=930990 RepID=A0A067N5S8_BOTB1|nr:hypothetical protein BOTBODRAFT_440293 [Botryobasidium botryosum FD-172 SS1]